MTPEDKFKLNLFENMQFFIIDLSKEWLSINPKYRGDFIEYATIEIQKEKDKIINKNKITK